MKKVILALSVLSCLFFAQTLSADGYSGTDASHPMMQTQTMMSNGNMSGSTMTTAPVGGNNEGVVYGGSCPQSWERPAGNGMICCCTYRPSEYCVCHCEQVPQYSYQRCCRYVPQEYQVTRCRYVPQYYCETCCRNVPQYYTTCQCKYCPKYTYEKKCCWVPCYSYKCEPCCPAPCAPACDPCCQQ